MSTKDQAPPYPTQGVGYPPQQPAYPPQQGGYPPQQAGYQTQQPGYQTQQPGYQTQQPGYPPIQGGYPGAPPAGGYPSQHSYHQPPSPAVVVNISDQQEGQQQDQPAMEDALAEFDAFSDKAVRRGFIRKVYGILTLQLLITFGITALFFFSANFKQFMIENPVVFYVAMVMSFVLIIVLSCCPNMRRKAPQNYIFLILFTICEGILIGSACASYDSSAVIKAVVTTIIIVVALTLFAFQTKIDFTMAYGLLFTLLMGLMIFGLMAAIFRSDIMDSMYAAMGAILFSMYIVVDTQLMMGGNHKLSISPEEYVFAALNLYLDIINLFLFLLRIFGGK